MDPDYGDAGSPFAVSSPGPGLDPWLVTTTSTTHPTDPTWPPLEMNADVEHPRDGRRSILIVLLFGLLLLIVLVVAGVIP